MASDKQDKVLNVPTLRFPEFTGVWRFRELQLLVPQISSGKDKPEEGTYTLYGSTGPMGKTSKASYNEEIVLVARVGANAGHLQIVNEPCGVTDNTLVLNGKDWNHYIYYYLQHYNLNKLVFGSGQPLITGGMLKKIRIFGGAQNERNKIVELLQRVDDRISTQIRIIEDLRNLKTYIHNRVFSKVNTLFGQRNTIRLSDIATKITRKNKGNTINNVLSNSAAMGIVPQAEVFDKEIANEDNTANYYVISNGDFVYNPRKSTQAPFGPINMYKGKEDGIISPLYLCFQVTNINKNYLLHYFMSNVWYSYIYSNGDTGVRHDRVSIKDETFLDMPLYIHAFDKQHEIANMMEQVDAKIALEELYLTKLQKQKDYLLSAMFV